PLPAELADRVVRGPADDRSHDLAAIGERPVGAGPGRVAEEVRITRGVGEIVEAAVFVHPRGFEEAPPVVAREQRTAFFVEDLNLAWRLREMLQVGGETRDTGPQRRSLGRRLEVIRRIFVVAVLLELPTPDAAEIHVELAVLVFEHGGVDRVGAGDRSGLGGEGARGRVAGGDADLEDA